MKKIIYLFASPRKDLSSEGDTQLFREDRIIIRSRELGYECEKFQIGYIKTTVKLDDQIGTWVFPIDNPDDHRHKCISTALLKQLEIIEPDLIVIKGLGYRLNHWLIKNIKFQFKLAFIVGGATDDILLNYADYILAETEHQQKNIFTKHYSRDRSTILPKLNLRVKPSTSEKVYDIINVGSFIDRKRQESLLPLSDKYQLALVGDGPNYNNIKKKSEERYNNIYLPGKVSRAEVTDLISKSKIMVHPATKEGLPRVVMEAFACGVPVVASKKTMPGAFNHGEHGLLVDPNEIHMAAEELLSNDEMRKEMAENAKNYVSRVCTEENVINAVKKMYRKVFVDTKKSKIRMLLIKLRINTFETKKKTMTIIRQIKSLFL